MSASNSTSKTQPVQETFSSELSNKNSTVNDANGCDNTLAIASSKPHVDRSTQDITDAPNKNDSYISEEFLAKFSSTMKDIMREMSSPLRPPPPGLFSRSSKTSQVGSVEQSTDSSSYSFCGSNASSEAVLVRQLEMCFNDADSTSQKPDASCHTSAFDVSSVDAADDLADRLAFELQGQHTELQILTQSMRQKREMILIWLDNILHTARCDPDRLTAEIEDCVTAVAQWDSTAVTNNREAEVKSLLDQVEQHGRVHFHMSS